MSNDSLTVSTIKPASKQATTYIGGAMVVLGNVLPYLTPQVLASMGIPGWAATAVLSILGVLLAAYQEKQKGATDTTVVTPEAKIEQTSIVVPTNAPPTTEGTPNEPPK